MPSSIETLIEKVMGELHRIVQTETVIGEPVQAGKVTLIPVSRISFGFGAGGQEGKGQSGTGGGATVEPIAFVVIDAEGETRILTLRDKEASLGQLVGLVPEALAKIRKFMGKRKKEGEEEGTEPESTVGEGR
ncbi:MAG: sporulation protein [Candidatus Handelsmanbacteria bacterium]|nr:sporulation protein [Candidatus Handelsmanbacteria bacterium]